jgi:ammonium transporter Rh
LFFLATWEVFLFSLNAAIVFKVLYVQDIGGALTIHMFGAFYGLSASWWFSKKKDREARTEEARTKPGYMSQTIAMLGTLFLFMYWPSFNSALAEGVAQQRSVVNTYIGISASVLTSCFIAAICKGKFDWEVMLNATLAGGVAQGACCDMITYGVYSFLIGMIAGTVSCIGYLYANPCC